jgi:hypothetical protein
MNVCVNWTEKLSVEFNCFFVCSRFSLLFAVFHCTTINSQIYLLDDTECSELCTCANGGDTLQLACHALCVPVSLNRF